MIKRIGAGMLAIMMAVSLMACGSSNETATQTTTAAQATEKAETEKNTEGATEAEKKTTEAAPVKTIKKIGVSINATSNENNRTMFENAQKEIKDRGYECVATNADGVISKEAQDIENLITQGCDALILINSDKDSVSTLVQQAKDAGIIVVTYAGGYIKDVDMDYELNNFKISSEMFMILAAEMGFEGNIIQCYDPTSGACRMRRNAQDAILKEYSAIKTVNDFVTIYPGTVADTATKAEAALLANPEATAVWGVEDLVALGVLQACEALGRDDVIMVGIDGEQDVLKHIYEGAKQIKATAIGNNEAGMSDCLDNIEKLASGEWVDLYHEIPYTVVTPANIADFYTPQ